MGKMKKNMKTVDEIHNKLYPQSSNEAEVLCSDANDNKLGAHPKGWKSLDREIRKRKRGQWKRENERKIQRRKRTRKR